MINIKKEQMVRDYWDKQPCDTKYAKGSPEASLEYFEEIEESRYKYQSFIFSFAQFTRWHKKKVLEIGCGCGTDLLQFAKAGANIYGIDMSPHSVELTKKRLALYGVIGKVRRDNAEDLHWIKDKTFDLVYCWGVIHHSPNPERLTAEIHRVLKTGGTLKAMVYHRFSALGLLVYLKSIKKHKHPLISLKAAFSESMESPGTKAFSFREIKELFKDFSQLKLIPTPIFEYSALRYIKLLSLSPLLKCYPDSLISWITIEGVKQR